ncbi:MAG: hypothetical protein AVDCRST_MAG50-2163, partial [uncultured Acidimicrobiales bacterium]
DGSRRRRRGAVGAEAERRHPGVPRRAGSGSVGALGPGLDRRRRGGGAGRQRIDGWRRRPPGRHAGRSSPASRAQPRLRRRVQRGGGSGHRGPHRPAQRRCRRPADRDGGAGPGRSAPGHRRGFGVRHPGGRAIPAELPRQRRPLPGLRLVRRLQGAGRRPPGRDGGGGSKRCGHGDASCPLGRTRRLPRRLLRVPGGHRAQHPLLAAGPAGRLRTGGARPSPVRVQPEPTQVLPPGEEPAPPRADPVPGPHAGRAAPAAAPGRGSDLRDGARRRLGTREGGRLGMAAAQPEAGSDSPAAAPARAHRAGPEPGWAPRGEPGSRQLPAAPGRPALRRPPGCVLASGPPPPL